MDWQDIDGVGDAEGFAVLVEMGLGMMPVCYRIFELRLTIYY